MSESLNEFKIQANIQVIKRICLVFGVAGTLIVAAHGYNYLNNQMNDGWVFNLIPGLVMMILGLGYTFGLFRLQIPMLVVNDQEIKMAGLPWSQSFKWKRLKSVKLEKKSIRVRYAMSGASDIIAIPYLLRRKQGLLDQQLASRCDETGIEYDSYIHPATRRRRSKGVDEMISQETLQEYFEQEIENYGTLALLLYSDRQHLKEGRYKEFAKELLNRSKKAYFWAVVSTVTFCLLGIVHFFDSASFGQAAIPLGLAYILGFCIVLVFATKEYYTVKGSMTLLLKFLDETEEVQTTEPETIQTA